jgi:hypothetical protein
MAPKKDVQAIVKAAESQGWTVKRTARGHYLFFSPNGDFVCDLSGTPSSQREVTNKLHRLRKAGLHWR